MMLKVRNFMNNKNHFVISTQESDWLQSYDIVVARRFPTKLYPEWDISKTTAKYVGKFLNSDQKAIRKAVKNGNISVSEESFEMSEICKN